MCALRYQQVLSLVFPSRVPRFTVAFTPFFQLLENVCRRHCRRHAVWSLDLCVVFLYFFD